MALGQVRDVAWSPRASSWALLSRPFGAGVECRRVTEDEGLELNTDEDGEEGMVGQVVIIASAGPR